MSNVRFAVGQIFISLSAASFVLAAFLFPVIGLLFASFVLFGIADAFLSDDEPRKMVDADLWEKQ